MMKFYSQPGKDLFLLLIFVFLAGHIKSANAQYFGQNKVQYEAFNFKILKTDHFNVYFYPEEEQAAKEAARMAERWYARYAKFFDHELSGRQPLILYATSAQFAQTNAIQGQLGEGTGGVTEPLKRRIVLPFGGSLAETNHVIGHELVHAFQYDITGQGRGELGGMAPSLNRLPLWFVEGMAEFLSLGPIDPNTAMWMRDAVKTMKKLPKVSDLENPKYFPYRWGQALLSYISGRWGDQAIPEMLKRGGVLGDMNKTIKAVLNTTPDSLSNDWHEALKEYYDPFYKRTEEPKKIARMLIGKSDKGGDLNIAPVLSPDGENVIFFSEKSLFAIDLFLADAKTGRIKRKIVSNELNPHFESLEFIYSSGTWSPDGEQVAFAAISQGRPILSFLNIRRDKIVREIKFKQLGSILNPSWSPDGRYIAFSAMVGGLSDLYIYDLQTDSLRRITNDSYADLQPDWSPDGRQIAFVTDRYSTDLKDLKPGNYQLSLYNPGTNEFSLVEGFPSGEHINPQWSPDGRSIYFISDQSGIANIYRKDLESGQIYQITNLYTGVSGITALSPAFSVATKANHLAFSAYIDSKYYIYSMDSLQTAPETVAQDTSIVSIDTSTSPVVLPEGDPSVLPPRYRATKELLALQDNPRIGLGYSRNTKVVNYGGGLALTYIGQPYLGAGVSRFGTLLGGGASAYFSDMLGNRNLYTMLQVQSGGGFTDIAGMLGYQNLTHRWNWGAVVQQIPYVLQGYGAGYAQQNGNLVYVEQVSRAVQTERDVTGFTSYPFNEASRIELAAGFQNFTFKNEVQTTVFDAASGAQLSRHTQKFPAPSALNLATASVAYVYDDSYFGATAPLLGQRFRIEAAPNVGNITYYTALFDYRKYVMPLKPFTFAFRALHYGRYGKNSEDSRFYELFLGYQSLVRGYDYNSFSAGECGTGGCSALNRLFGSKLAVANFELRFPLLGAFGIGPGFYGYFPIDTGVFYDAGVAWTKEIKPNFLGGSRKPVTSYGPFVRINVFGYVVAEIDYVKPVDRPNKGWYWEFSLNPGF